ncbi:MAG: thioredoxin [Gammaproteobacteria bacterium]|nr:MAG: thioredoxin [Gammaproteobacteria bacterium]RLA39881.1 MAG: thioredoxin [Gammaproteobacteria bacterium]
MTKAAELIFDVDLEQFEEKVLIASKDTPILVDLWAEWCSPCLVIAPILKQLIEEYNGELKLAKVEVDEDENMKLAGRYQVRGFPTVLLIINGEETARFSGAKSLSFLRDFVEEHSGTSA